MRLGYSAVLRSPPTRRRAVPCLTGPSEPVPSVEVRFPTRGGWPVSLFRCACRRVRRCQRPGLRRCHSGPWKPAPLRAGGQARPGGRRAGWTSPASARPEQARTSKAPGTEAVARSEARWGICRLRVGSRLQGTQWHCPPQWPGPGRILGLLSARRTRTCRRSLVVLAASATGSQIPSMEGTGS